MTCKELARRLEGTGVTSLVAHPGLAVTDHFGKSDSENKLSSKLVEGYANSPIGQTSEGGAIPLEFACTAPELEGMLCIPYSIDSILGHFFAKGSCYERLMATTFHERHDE